MRAPVLTLLLALGLPVFTPAQAEAPVKERGWADPPPALEYGNPKDPCLRARIALDMGSGSTKARSGVVNICLQKLIVEIARDKKAIPFKDHLSAQPKDEDGAQKFSQDFMDKAEADIVELVTKVKQETVNKLKADPKLANYAYLADLKMEASGVATQAFREAANAKWFVWEMGHGKGRDPIKVNIISQTQEGHLGFMGVMSALALAGDGAAADPAKLVSWDIGGGSLQIVAYSPPGPVVPAAEGGSEYQWLDFGNRFASNPVRVLITTQFKKIKAFTADKAPVSPNPIIPPQGSSIEWKKMAQTLDAMTRENATKEFKSLLEAGWIAPGARSVSGREVYGIGGVHNGILGFLQRMKGKGKGKEVKGYSSKQLGLILDQLLAADDDLLVGNYGVNKEFSNATVTNMVLVKTVMDLLGIEKIHVLDVDNSYGSMIAPAFWEDAAFSIKTQTANLKQLNP